jgi:tetratricopeptide (TPR) repeat protein
LGDAGKAIEYHEQALVIAREIGDRKGEGNRLCNLGSAYYLLGNNDKTVKFLEQALLIAREIGNKYGESVSLNNLGELYASINQPDTAFNYFEQALSIRRGISNLYGVGSTCGNIARVYIDKGLYNDAIKFAQESIAISQEISSPLLGSRHTYTLGLAYLLQNDLVNARTTIEAALGYDVPDNNHNASALYGIITLRQGEEVAARGTFLRAIGQADEILSKTAEFYEALDAKGLSICGLLICDLQLKSDGGQLTVDGGRLTADGEGQTTVNNQPATDYRQQAIETFRKARKIAPHAGIVKSVLRLFDELAKCDQDGILKEVRNAAEGV